MVSYQLPIKKVLSHQPISTQTANSQDTSNCKQVLLRNAVIGNNFTINAEKSGYYKNYFFTKLLYIKSARSNY